MEIIGYITINLLLFSSWYILLFRYKNYLLFVDRILGAFVLGLAQIILTETILGVLFKKLFATPLFILNVSISLCVLIFAAVIRKGADVYPVRNKTLPGFSNGVFRELKNKISQFINILKSDWILLGIFILFSASFFCLVFIGYLFPSYSWDALLYHLPMLGYILQSGAIEKIPDYSLIYTFLNIFPKNIELFFLWNVIFLKSAAIVDVSQMFFTLTGMLAIYSIAIKLNIKKKYAIYSSFLFFFAPIIIFQSTMEYVDIAMSVLFLIAINFTLLTPHLVGGTDIPPRRWAMVLTGITAGILLGSKGSGPLFVFALTILFLINELKTPLCPTSEVGQRVNMGKGIKKIIVRYVIYFIVPVILLGGYWYIQNWINYHNPVYPFEVKVFNKILFAGMFTEILDDVPEALVNLSFFAKPFYVWLEKEAYYIYYSYLSGLGPIWFILFLPGMVFSIFYTLRKKRYDFLLIAFILIITFILSPRNWNPRYVIFILGLGSLSFVFMLEYFEKRERILEFFVLIFVLYTIFVSNSPCVTPEKIKEFVNLSAKERTLAKMDTPCLISERHNYGYWTWISNNISAGDTLAYNFHPTLLAPLWNSNFTSKIIYLRSKNIIEWQKDLEKNKVDYVLLWQKSVERWWIMRLEELKHIQKWSAIYDKFEVVYSDKEYMVLKFVK